MRMWQGGGEISNLKSVSPRSLKLISVVAGRPDRERPLLVCF